MITIKAKENATIEVVDGSFPLGQRNCIKVYIEDQTVKDIINSIGTDTMIKPDNLYSYGNFSSLSDINSVKFNLSSLENNVSVNFDNSLRVFGSSEENKQSCILKADRYDLIPGKTYTISCYLSCDELNSELTLECQPYFNNTIVCENKTIEKQIWTTSFVATTSKTEFDLTVVAKGNWYISNLQLFSIEKEINKYYDDIYFSVNVENPIQNISIDRLVTLNKEDMYIILYLPPVTLVDYQDNLLCRFSINLLQEPRNKYLGDSIYNKENICIYNSETFILNGYMIVSENGDGIQ